MFFLIIIKKFFNNYKEDKIFILFYKYFLYKYFLHNIIYEFIKPKKIIKSDLMMIADMRGVKVRTTSKKDALFRILKKNVKKNIQ